MKFKFDNTIGNKSTAITLDELSQTTAGNNYDVPNHATGIREILKTVQTVHSDAELTETYVANGRAHWKYNNNADPLKQSLLENYIFEQLIAKINIPVKINGGSLKLAIKFDDNKYTVAFGAEIEVCSNMMILGRGDVIQTGRRGSDRMNFTAVINAVKSWMQIADDKAKQVDRFIEKTNNVLLTQSNVNELLGVLSRSSVMNAPKQILKGYQVTNLCKNINKVFSSNGKPAPVSITGWQLWNEATNDIEVYNTDLGSYIDNSLNITRFCDSFEEHTTLQIT